MITCCGSQDEPGLSYRDCKSSWIVHHSIPPMVDNASEHMDWLPYKPQQVLFGRFSESNTWCPFWRDIAWRRVHGNCALCGRTVTSNVENRLQMVKPFSGVCHIHIHLQIKSPYQAHHALWISGSVFTLVDSPELRSYSSPSVFILDMSPLGCDTTPWDTGGSLGTLLLKDLHTDL